MFVILKKDGFYYKENGKQLPIKFNTDFFVFWEERIEIEGEVTLERLCDILRKDEQALQLISYLTRSNLKEYFKELKKDGEKNKIEYIEISKHFEKNKYEENGNSEVSVVLHCSGIENSEGIAIEFCNWSSLKHLPIKISNEGIFMEDYNYKSREKINTWFTVSQFFNCLFGELCFFDLPETREEKFKDLKETIERIDNGEEELIPWEEVKKSLEQKREKVSKK